MGVEEIKDSRTMKKIRCPKCENYLTFDETKYEEGQSLVFVCEHCRKQFSIRIKKKSSQEQPPAAPPCGSITVIENRFAYKQEFPLKEGDNLIGRRCIGTSVDIPIETSDMSMDRRHCVIHAKKKDGKTFFTLRDNASLTGTFLQNELLGDKEQARLEDGSVVTIGATTFVLHIPSDDRCK